jgi:hypothetical protein
MKEFKFSESGYTTLELMIAIQLSLMLTSIIFVSYFFVSILISRWEEKTGIEEQLSEISRILSVKINGIREFNSAGVGHFSATDENEDTLTITLHPELEINGHLFQLKNINFTEGNFRYILKPSQVNSEITIVEYPDLSQKQRVSGLDYFLEFKIHNRTYQLRSTVYLQKYRYRQGWGQKVQD